MTRALIIGNSGGIGAALEAHLLAEGAKVTGLSRARDRLDVTDEASIETHLGALEPGFDMVVVATGALSIAGTVPEKSIRVLSADALRDQYSLNAVGPALVLKHSVRLLPRRSPAVFAALSARVGSISDNNLGGWHSYRASKAALNQLIHGAAIELARSHTHLCVACLHPGTVETAFTRAYLDRHPATPAPEAAARLVAVLRQLSPAQTGGFYDYAMKEIPW